MYGSGQPYSFTSCLRFGHMFAAFSFCKPVRCYVKGSAVFCYVPNIRPHRGLHANRVVQNRIYAPIQPYIWWFSCQKNVNTPYVTGTGQPYTRVSRDIAQLHHSADYSKLSRRAPASRRLTALPKWTWSFMCEYKCLDLDNLAAYISNYCPRSATAGCAALKF
jgi:hypothetical protein